MAELLLHFDVTTGADTTAAARTLQERLGALPMVEEAEALPQESRVTGLEIAGAISAAVIIVRHGRELVTELRKLIPEVKKLVQEIKGLKAPSVEIGARRVRLDEITESDLEELAK